MGVLKGRANTFGANRKNVKATTMQTQLFLWKETLNYNSNLLPEFFF